MKNKQNLSRKIDELILTHNFPDIIKLMYKKGRVTCVLTSLSHLDDTKVRKKDAQERLSRCGIRWRLGQL